ncbi:hypothetical protein pah_c028o015 [Parachlamydia acanthamoebae str. Hall's coccus]|nr:hypothetical protein pah_c028o015 [Parachlamydia acanthamoebae str. Hall's coccus]
MSFSRVSSQEFPLPASFKDLLKGKKAFYKRPDYVETTKQDFSQNPSLQVSYTWNSESRVIRIAKKIFAIIIFPIGIHKLLHSLAGKIFLLPSSTPVIIGYPENYADQVRSNISLHSEWRYKRIAIQVDGYKIDATIVGKTSTLSNGRWVLESLGNGQFCEEELMEESTFKKILTSLHGNGLVFNYPGVGSSTGLPSRKAMAKAYRAMLNFLEDQKIGIGAKEIIGYGHSIGGGSQSDALKKHPLKKDIKYVFVKSRSFSTLYRTAIHVTYRPLAFLVKILGWNMNSSKVSEKLQAPEIILQTAKVASYEEIKNSSKIIDDGIITAKASLAKKLLDDEKCAKRNKIFIGIPDDHFAELSDPTFLATRIESLLKTS